MCFVSHELPALIHMEDLFVSTSTLSPSPTTTPTAEPTTTMAPTRSPSSDNTTEPTTNPTASPTLWTAGEQPGIFTFDVLDEVTIDRMMVQYTYDMDNCEDVDGLDGEPFNSHADRDGDLYECPSTALLIVNRGLLELTDFFLSVNMTNVIDEGVYFYNTFEYSEGAFIENFGDMDISNWTMTESVAHFMFFNQGELSLSALSYDFADNHSFNVNALRSTHIVKQHGSSSSSVDIADSQFVGGTHAAWIRLNVCTLSVTLTQIRCALMQSG